MSSSACCSRSWWIRLQLFFQSIPWTTDTQSPSLADSKPFQLPYQKTPYSQWRWGGFLKSLQESFDPVRAHMSPLIGTKRDGSLRLCTQFRKLTSCSIRDTFPLPRKEEALEALQQAKNYFTLDLSPIAGRLNWQNMTRQHLALLLGCCELSVHITEKLTAYLQGECWVGVKQILVSGCIVCCFSILERYLLC